MGYLISLFIGFGLGWLAAVTMAGGAPSGADRAEAAAPSAKVAGGCENFNLADSR